MKLKEILILISIIAVDQLTKFWATNALQSHTIEVIPDFFRLLYVENDGAAWSMLSGKMWVFYVVTIIYLVFFSYYLFKKTTINSLLRLSIIFIIAGTLGNFIDRLRLKYVVDFISFNIFGYDFPVFNVADMAIVLGAIGLIIYTLFSAEKEDVS